MIKEILICFAILFNPLYAFAANENPQKIIVVKTKSMSEGKISNVHAFNIKIDVQNLSSKTFVRDILLDAVLYNKSNDVIASKLAAVRWDKMKPFVKRSFVGKIKNTFEKLKTEETPRKRMENLSTLRPSETREFEIAFYDEDLKSSETKDKVPVAYSVKFHSAKIVLPN